MKILSPKAHGVIDYVLVAVLALGPTVLGFTGTPQMLSYGAAAALLLLSLSTAYPLGILKLVPFTWHRNVEIVIVPTLLAAPWLFQFSDDLPARNFFLVSGVIVGIVVAITNYLNSPVHVAGGDTHGTLQR